MSYVPAELYTQILENIPIPCVDVALVAEGAVLLVKRKDAPAVGQWWLPGGRVLKGEMMRETAARKARDEVGIACYVGPIILTEETIFPDGPGGIPVHSVNSCFFVYPQGANVEPTLDEHHAGCVWVEAIPEGLHPYVERCLLGAGLRRRDGFRLP